MLEQVSQFYSSAQSRQNVFKIGQNSIDLQPSSAECTKEEVDAGQCLTFLELRLIYGLRFELEKRCQIQKWNQFLTGKLFLLATVSFKLRHVSVLKVSNFAGLIFEIRTKERLTTQLQVPISMAWLEQSLILQRNMERPKNICKKLYNYFLYFKTKIQN